MCVCEFRGSVTKENEEFKRTPSALMGADSAAYYVYVYVESQQVVTETQTPSNYTNVQVANSAHQQFG